MNREIVTDEYGNIDWNANGWPEPNPYGDSHETVDGVELTTDGMPNDIFEEWLDACDLQEQFWELE